MSFVEPLPKISSSSSSSYSSSSSSSNETASSSKDAAAAATIPPLNYTPPPWAGTPPLEAEYFLEMLKEGTIIGRTDLTKSTTVVGRLPICDISLEHGSISRYHAIIQFGDDGKVFLYDMKSTHGTKVGRVPVPERKFVRLFSGAVIKFGESTRLYVFNGPDVTTPNEELAAVLKQRRQAETLGADAMLMQEGGQQQQQQQNNSEASGISWGILDDDDMIIQHQMAEQAEEASHEDWFLQKDPRKILRSWLENNGAALEFEYEQDSLDRTFAARLRLPIEGPDGPLFALGSGRRKKEAEYEAIVDGCRKIDAQGLLRSATIQTHAERAKQLKEMYGEDDDDQDTFYDRTEIAEKRRKKAGGGGAKEALTYDSLMEKRASVLSSISEIERQLSEGEKGKKKKNKNKESQASGADDEGDDIDSYVASLKTEMDQQKAAKWKVELEDLRQEQARLEKLIKVAAPSIRFDSVVLSSARVNASDAAEPPAATDGAASTDSGTGSVEQGGKSEASTGRDGKRPLPTGGTEEPEIAPPPTTTTKKRQRTMESPLTQAAEPTDADAATAAAGRDIETNTAPEVDYASWRPPEGQSGDGRTSLNDKYGY